MLRFLPRSPVKPTAAQLEALRPYGGALAQLLWARGVETAAQAEAFLSPSKQALHNPLALHGMGDALAILQDAREKGIKTVVYGDYDVDGMCATALLCQALHRFGLEAAPHIPLRAEGYGLNAQAVEALAKEYSLLITVDLGITNAQEVTLAQKRGMRVIVTDHHQLGLVPCPADAVITPLLDGYPCPKLCGTGVAFQLARALLGPQAEEAYLDLAALATVADIVPLTGENRALVALGLPYITARKRPGLAALLEVSASPQEVDSYTLGFQLAPRLNAAGRLGDAGDGVRLLLTQDPGEAKALAAQLNQLNTRRREMEAQVLDAALAQAKAQDFVENRALIVKGEGWHVGVVGLAAGRLCQRYGCPTVALSQEGDLLHGSLRSIPGVNIHQCLQSCDALLTRYGGHEQAAGCTLPLENYPEFCRRMQQAVAQAAPEEAFMPTQEYDLPLSLRDASQALAREIQRMAPFGMGNPAPLFVGRGMTLERRRACGTDGSHVQLTLRQGHDVLEGIGFGMAREAMALPPLVDGVFSLKEDTFRGQAQLKCEMKALRPAEGAALASLAQEENARFENALVDALVWLADAVAKADSPGNEAEEKERVLPWPEGDVDFPPLQPKRGVLYVARSRASAQRALAGGKLELCWHLTESPLCFPTLLALPLLGQQQGSWRTVWLLDGELMPGEAVLWARQLPKAQVRIGPRGLAGLATATDGGDEAYRGLYRYIRGHACQSLAQVAAGAGLTLPQCRVGLTAFAQLGLVQYTESPFACTLLPPAPCALGDSPLLGALRRLAGE